MINRFKSTAHKFGSRAAFVCNPIATGNGADRFETDINDKKK